MMEEAFRPFRRLTPVDGEATPGTGLGLSVARSIVRGLGGDIELTNHAHGGLQVTVILPRSQAHGRHCAQPFEEKGVRQAHMAA